MALIKCPECKKKISDRCESCPNCGYPMKEYLESEYFDEEQFDESEQTFTSKEIGIIKIFTGIVIVLVCIMLVAGGALILIQSHTPPDNEGDMQPIVATTTNFTTEAEIPVLKPSEAENTTSYHTYRKCNVKIAVEFVPNIFFNKYGVDVLIDEVIEGTMVHGEADVFAITVDPGEHSIRFENEESSSVKGEMVLYIDCDMEVGYKISCYGDRIDVETLYIDRFNEIPENKVKIDVDASAYKYKNYLDVESTLRNLGFTNIKYNILYDIVFGWTEIGEVDNVSIDGTKDFKRGEIFNVNDEVVITYHMPVNDSTSNATNIKMANGSSYYKGMDYQEVKKQFENMGLTNVVLEKVTTEDTTYNDGYVFSVQIGGKSFEAADIVKSSEKVCIKYYVITSITSGSPVFYSTNDYKTATKGNTGVFSYKKDGSSYDIYWIIDFDEGYVYYFVDGDGDSGCDRIKIDFGTLNDRVTITYHAGTDVWSYILHFKYTNSPVTLIMVDQNGFKYEFSATDLNKALALRSTKKIVNY